MAKPLFVGLLAIFKEALPIMLPQSPEMPDDLPSALVAVEAAAPGFYTYLAPPELGLEVGQMVQVPFGRRDLIGYVMNLGKGHGGAPGALKSIRQVLKKQPLFGPDFTRLVEFVSGYYLYPAGLCVKEILPGGIAPKLELFGRLTELGLGSSWPEDGSPADKALALLKGLYPEGAVAGPELKPGFQKLSRAGLAELSYILAGKAMTFAYEWWLSPSPEPPLPLPRLGAREKEIWELLKSSPPVPLSYFRHYVKDPLPKARSLEAKGLAVLEKRELMRDDPHRAANLPSAPVIQLTEEQNKALLSISEAMDLGQNKGFLLFGVTGSGKTEIYLRAAQKALDQGKGVLWLTPEIALTLGLEGRIRERFPGRPLSVLHSGLSAGERHDHWLGLSRGQSLLAMGARSAVFAPVRNLGLVIVDEEHDGAYKQDDGLRYNARDLAAWRAKDSRCVLILGSATPSLESYQGTVSGRLSLLRLADRPGQAALPQVSLVDRRRDGRARDVLSPALKKELRETFSRGEQALLFLNRRGFSSLPMCLSCGEPLKCPHCSLTLTLHAPPGPYGPYGQPGKAVGLSLAGDMEPGSNLVCHGCGYRAFPPEHCPLCRSPLVRYLGVGTEKLLELLENSFSAKGLKLDADSARKKGGIKDILEAFGRAEADFLVGTQMAAKGHDFENLTLVGVVEADIGINLPDFRAAERTFQLLSQVSGRAGRGDRPGKVIIQTLNPGHYALASAQKHDYLGFFESEIALRRELGYPPFARLALIRLSGKAEARVSEAAEAVAQEGRKLLEGFPAEEMEILGPAPSPTARLRERYRYQIMLRSVTAKERHRTLKAWLPAARKIIPKEVAFSVDVDPYHLL